MADFAALGERLRKVREDDVKEADKLMERLAAHEARRKEVVSRAHDHITQKAAEITGLENDLNQLSNALPTEAGSPPAKG